MPAPSGSIRATQESVEVESLASPPAVLERDTLFGALLERQTLELREWAETDPLGAMRRAGLARFKQDRLSLQRAALEGWARQDPLAAARYAADFALEEREGALFAALRGAAIEPEGAFQVMDFLVEEAALEGAALRRAKLSLVSSLAQHGHFGDAVGFARVEGEAAQRAVLLEAGLSQWARFQPEAAVSSAMSIDNTQEREAAFSVVTATWGGVDPGGLAEFADELPKGRQRSEVMRQALQQWVARAPLEAAEWMEGREPAAELDTGVLALATHPYLAERSPLVAVSWAESLWDENLRANTLSLVLKQWAATDRRAAIAYVRESPEIPLAERQELLALFGEPKEFGIDGSLQR
ncbi:hypothetical protein QEH56_23330 [Pelagicoccus enzymogenes]|uniref:hypothetical protein n=1 Tax=Pelagicoccus enzymogenes TaxID=2773457 RepID=UPI0028106BC5|nr:hypothetical protein [Pelagicoccus enzymogenes]MDQ8201118.1 hypothetical protein [Pelagicoccus enzymogenes]